MGDGLKSLLFSITEHTERNKLAKMRLSTKFDFEDHAEGGKEVFVWKIGANAASEERREVKTLNNKLHDTALWS
jgi:hypothetical protein